MGTSKLSTAETEKDEADRAVQSLSISEGNASDKLMDPEQQLKEAKLVAEESDRKYEEVQRKLVAVEGDLERAEDKADEFTRKYNDVQNELDRTNETLGKENTRLLKDNEDLEAKSRASSVSAIKLR